MLRHTVTKMVINYTFQLFCKVSSHIVCRHTICTCRSEKIYPKTSFHVASMEEYTGVHRMLVGKPEGKRPSGRPRRRWEDNIKMDLQKVGGGRGDWIELAQDRDRWRALVGTVRDFRVP